MYSNTAPIGDLGKVRLTATQKATVKAARQQSAVTRKLAKVAAKTAKVQYKADLASAKRAKKLAKYAPDPVTAQADSSGMTQVSPVIPSSADFSSFGAAPMSVAPSGGGGGGFAPGDVSSPVAPTDAASGETNFMPWILGAAAIAAVVLLKKKG